MISIAVLTARILFGVTAVVACVMLLFGIFIFDSPGSTRNPLAWNLALAPLVYLGIYVISLLPPAGINGQAPGARARLFRAFMPLLGIAWYGFALLMIESICHGNFAC
jgi:hypothetical protein